MNGYRTIKVPEAMKSRETRLKSTKDGRLKVAIERRLPDKNYSGDGGMDEAGWLAEKDFWTQIFTVSVDLSAKDFSLTDFDNIFRYLKQADKYGGKNIGGIFMEDDRTWTHMPDEHIRRSLISLDYSKNDADAIIGAGTRNRWSLVNLPFQPEYPGNRQWNLGAAQYRYQPADLADDDAPHHPHWDKVFNHCGDDLTEAIARLAWAQECGIKTGGDYLKAWTACMLREPLQPLPYLFLYGEKQNSGKSMLHEAIELLMDGGVANAKHALTTKGDFNGELANIVLAYIEETNISKSPGAYSKIKDWTTSPHIQIRMMRKDAYLQTNCLHFIQTANEMSACPVRDGDTRITVAYVSRLLPGEEIPKSILLDRLRAEAPHFMRTLMDLVLPPLMGRMRLPVVETVSKQIAQDANKSPLEDFIDTTCYEIEGEYVTFKEFKEKFQAFLDPGDSDWGTKKKIKQDLPRRFPITMHTHLKQLCIGNLSFKKAA